MKGKLRCPRCHLSGHEKGFPRAGDRRADPGQSRRSRRTFHPPASARLQEARGRLLGAAPPCLAWAVLFHCGLGGGARKQPLPSRLPFQPPSLRKFRGHRPAPPPAAVSRPRISQRKSYGLSNISTPAPMTGHCETRDAHMTCRFLSSEAWALSNSGTRVPRKWPRSEGNEAESSQEPAAPAPCRGSGRCGNVITQGNTAGRLGFPHTLAPAAPAEAQALTQRPAQ